MSFPIWILLFPFLICSFHLATAQDNFWGQYCGVTGNYTPNSAYQRNLDDVLYSLTGTNNGFGFYNSTSGQAHAAALCRGDIKPESCRRCVDDATRRLRQVCPNQMEAVGWYDTCFLRYSNRPAMGNEIGVFGFNRGNISDSSYDEWKQTVNSLLGTLLLEAVSGGQLRKYASENITAPGLLTVYGMMQCIPDLSATECDDCLTGATRTIQQFDRSLGARAFMTSCLIRYESYQFFNSTWFPTHSGNKKSTNIGLIVGPIAVAAAIIAVVFFLFLFRRHQKRKRKGLLLREFSDTIVGQQRPNQLSNSRPTVERRQTPAHLKEPVISSNIQIGGVHGPDLIA